MPDSAVLPMHIFVHICMFPWYCASQQAPRAKVFMNTLFVSLYSR